MACAYPQWRLSWSEALLGNGWERHRLADKYEKRVYHDGVILQRPEFEMLKNEYPFLASKAQQIPCGKCIQCRLTYSREWASRCMAELKTSERAIFVTLTYDDKFLKFAPFVDPDLGTVDQRPVLYPKHLQKFIKSLRTYTKKHFGTTNIRFFACGEYGDANERPHYHAIIYNVPLEIWQDSHLFTLPGEQPALFTSPLLDKLWKKGLVVFGDVSWNTCAYVARYVVKKRKGKDAKAQKDAQAALFPDAPWQPEFVRMSRRPGIGRKFYDEHVDEIYAFDEMYVNVKGSIQAVKPAAYYDKLYDVDHHLELRRIKANRVRVAQAAMEVQLSKTDLTEEDYLKVKLDNKDAAAKRLLRPI